MDGFPGLLRPFNGRDHLCKRGSLFNRNANVLPDEAGP
jgi:hypothetical protein